MTDDEYKSLNARVSRYLDIKEEIMNFELAIKELEAGAIQDYGYLQTCIYDYGLITPIRKLFEKRIEALKKEALDI